MAFASLRKMKPPTTVLRIINCYIWIIHNLIKYVIWLIKVHIEAFVISCVDTDIPSYLETYEYKTNKTRNAHDTNDGTNREILVFIHGFPDNHSVWDKQIKYFANDYICYTMTLPNFNTSNFYNKYGYDWNIVAIMIANKLKEISIKNNSKNITLIMHGFGTIYGCMAYRLLSTNIDHKNIVKNLVFIDVGDGLDLKTGLIQQIAYLFYHFYLLFAFFLPDIIGKYLIFFICYHAGSPLCRQYKLDKLSNYMIYPYFHLLRRRLNIGGPHINCDDLTLWNIPNDVNIFFGFGREFFIKCHTKQWKKYLKSDDQCFYKGYKCGHWVMWYKSNEFNYDLDRWLKKVS